MSNVQSPQLKTPDDIPDGLNQGAPVPVQGLLVGLENLEPKYLQLKHSLQPGQGLDSSLLPSS